MLLTRSSSVLGKAGGRWHEAHDPSAHARSVARLRGPLRQERGLLWLLVHVWADRERLSSAAAGGEQGSVPGDRVARAAAGVARLQRRSGRGLVPADPARLRALARSPLAPRARRRPAGLVALLLLYPHRLSPEGRVHGAHRCGARGGERGEGASAGSLSLRRKGLAERLGHRLCHDLRAGRIRDRRPPGAGPPDHALRSGDRPREAAKVRKMLTGRRIPVIMAPRRHAKAARPAILDADDLGGRSDEGACRPRRAAGPAFVRPWRSRSSTSAKPM